MFERLYFGKILIEMTKKNTISEAQLQHDALKFFKQHGIFAWRMPISPVLHRLKVGRRTQTIWKASPLKGFPDVAGVFQKKQRGRMFVIEFKSETGRLNDNQKLWRNKFLDSGVAYLECRSMKQLVEFLIYHEEVRLIIK